MLPFAIRIAREQLHIGFIGLGCFIEVEHTVLHRDKWRKFGEDQFGYGEQVALTLQQSSELCEVRFQPVLRRVFIRRFAQVANHFIDVIFQCGYFACRIYCDGS